MSSPGSFPPEPPAAPVTSSSGNGAPRIEPPLPYGYEAHGSAGLPGPPGTWAPGYQPGYAVPYRRNNGLSIASMATGIASLVFCGFGVVLSVVALVLGIVGLQQVNKDPSQQGKGFAIAGIVCGLIGLLLQALIIAMWIGLFAVSRQIETPPPG